MKNTKPNYGQEMIPLLLIMTVLLLITSSVLFYLAFSGYKNSTFIIIISGLAVISGIVLATGLWSSRIGKLIFFESRLKRLDLKLRL